MQSPSFGLAGLGLRCCEPEDVRSIAGLQFRGSSQNRLLAESVGISFRPSYNMPHRIAEHFFNRTVRFLTLRVLAATCRQAQWNPVGCAIAGPTRSCRINKRFEKVDRTPVDPRPIARQHQRHPTQNMRCQVRNMNPWQDQETCVVGNETNIAAASFRRPSDETIAWPQMARR